MPNATYRAPAGDSEVVTIAGVRFFDGQAVELDHGEHERLLGKLSMNPHFEVDGYLAAGSAGLGGEHQPVMGLRAIHKGRGKYAIVRGDEDTEVKEGLSKADADAFNALTEADKEEYVA